MAIYTISDSIHVDAPLDRCFLLSTSVDLVAQTLNMRPVSGRSHGLIRLGDRIYWKGWKFALPQSHESLITEYQPPTFFQDTMASGRFKRFQHDHAFSEISGHTLIEDKIRFSLHWGWFGDLIANRILVPYIARLLHRRLLLLRRVAETDEWKSYISDEPSVNRRTRPHHLGPFASSNPQQFTLKSIQEKTTPQPVQASDGMEYTSSHSYRSKTN